MTLREPALLKISDLHVSFSSKKNVYSVLRGISLEINKNEILGVIGESGSGKSVTVLSILKLLGPSGEINKGEILFDNIALQDKSEQEMQRIRGKKIGVIFQDPINAFNPTLTVGRQIAETLVYHESLSKSAAVKMTIELLDFVAIPDPAKRYYAYPFQLSGGMLQRVMIAHALSCSPMLLIADEPTTALDVTIQAQILELFRKIKKNTNMGILLITHDLGVASGICDKVAIMKEGKIVETGDVETVFKNPIEDYSKALIKTGSKEFDLHR